MPSARMRWAGGVAALALAVGAATGVLLRFGLLLGMPGWAQNYVAVRHAHSHLMYFGWVTLGLMALVWHFLPILTDRHPPRGAGAHLAVVAALALLSFPAFWANGYGPTPVFGRDLPLGSMAAGLNGLAWFGFVWLYVRATWRLAVRPLPVRLWDWGLVLLVVASLGAVGLAALVALDAANPFLQQFFLHLFLDLFAVGWFSLGLFGVIWAGLAQQHGLPEGLPVETLAIALAPTFVLGMSPLAVTPGMFWLAAVANAAAVALFGRHLWALWVRRRMLSPLLWFACAALALHLAGTLLTLWPGFWRWSAGTQLRVYVLHMFLLGWVSSGLLAVWADVRGYAARRGWRVAGAVWMGGVTVMLLALAGLGLVGVAPVAPRFWLQVAAWSSILPALVAVWVTIVQWSWTGQKTQAGDAA